MSAPDFIHIESMYGALSRTPFVKLKWGENEGMLTPEEAVKHAMRVLEVAAGAEMDAVFIRWLTEKLGVTEDEKIAEILQDFRAMRS